MIGGFICVTLILVWVYFRIEASAYNQEKIFLKSTTEVAFSLMAEYEGRVKSGEFTDEEARKRATSRIKNLRYNGQEYFWINDLSPRMVMHPFKPELDGKDLADFKDPTGKLLFVEMVKACKDKGDGFVDYMWPKPGKSKPVPKLSYVKVFRPWGWIVGSGIYMDDIARELAAIRALFLSAMAFIAVIGSLLCWKITGFVKPIACLTSAAQRLGGGDLTTRTSLLHAPDELGQLAKSFDDMASLLEKRSMLQIRTEEELFEAYDGLEVKVAERTAELAAANEYLENIFESSPDVIVIVDEQGKFIKWNMIAADLLGYSFEEMRGKSAFELYPDKNRLDEMLTDLRRDGSVKNYVIDMSKKYGGVAAFEISISLLKNGVGNTVGSISVARDLGPVTRANEELQREVERRITVEASLRESEAVSRESEKKYRTLYQEFHALLDAIPDVLVLLTPDFNAVWANRAYAVRAGKDNDPSSLIGQPCYKELHGREEPCDGCPAPKSFNLGEPCTAVISTARGEIFEVRTVPVKDDHGTVIKLINLARDITETRKAEEELQRTFTEMAQVFTAIPSFLIGLTAEGRIMRWNQRGGRNLRSQRKYGTGQIVL